eukprot:scaffold3121_cov365-Prasinococcus_capsulatus_cf.AAC.3
MQSQQPALRLACALNAAGRQSGLSRTYHIAIEEAEEGSREMRGGSIGKQIGARVGEVFAQLLLQLLRHHLCSTTLGCADNLLQPHTDNQRRHGQR